MSNINYFKEQETFVDNEQQADKLDIKEKLEAFSDERLVSGRITENSARATFLVDKDVLEKLSDLVDYMEATSSLDSRLNEDKTVKEIRDMRLFAKGFKSKFVGYALSAALEEYEADMGVVPHTERVRYKASDGTYHRSFKYTKDNVTYLLTQDNRGHEIEFMDSENFPIQDIETKFQSYVDRAESQSKK